MLNRLTIRNYATIDKLEIEFCNRMNIITGETGAGKSILLGALSLILGDRADTKVLYDKDEKCVVEAHFNIDVKGLKNFFIQHELDFDNHTIVRREINQSGKSRAFINDTPVTLNILKDLGERLVNLHSQHETLELTKAGFQLSVIDTLAKNQEQISVYRTRFSQYKKDAKQLEQLVEQHRISSSESDFLQFQYKELAEAQLNTNEQLKLETELNTLGNVEEIKRSLTGATQLISESEISILDQLSEVQSQLKTVKNLNQNIGGLADRLHSAYEELKDIGKEFEAIQDQTFTDPERLEVVHARLNIIYRLQKKHNVSTIDELLQLQNNFEFKLTQSDNNTLQIEELKAALQKQVALLETTADALHFSREKVLREFQNNVVVLLTKVGMPNSSFKVDIKKLDTLVLNENGLTEIKFLFSANKGFAPSEIKDVASGGELSRLMLSIKSLVADTGAMPTMIFDEIDTGISGEVALKVSEIMKKISRQHQLISITHLPQIARTADCHLYIYKETKGDRTQTRIRELKGDERVVEIAKMLSGDKVSDASLANARELMGSL